MDSMNGRKKKLPSVGKYTNKKFFFSFVRLYNLQVKSTSLSVDEQLLHISIHNYKALETFEESAIKSISWPTRQTPKNYK
jgi:hypothetical protein